jgi:hypothetical protein
MAFPNTILINALRTTAQNLAGGAKYEWGHMGRCNCGHLVQTITKLSDKEIAKVAEHELDEWTEHAKDYCTNTGSKVDSLFEEMKAHGFFFDDMVKLEYLKDKGVLQRLGNPTLRHNVPNDVARYMQAMADMLEESKAE